MGLQYSRVYFYFIYTTALGGLQYILAYSPVQLSSHCYNSSVHFVGGTLSKHHRPL